MNQSDINSTIRDIAENREKIIENFFAAFLAANIPDKADQNWVVNNIELIEVKEKNETRAFFRRRTDLLVSKRKWTAVLDLLETVVKIAALNPDNQTGDLARAAILNFKDKGPVQ